MTDDELEEAREGMRVHREDFAKALGISDASLAEMEDGGEPVPPSVAMAVRYMIEHPEARPATRFEDIRVQTGTEVMAEFLSERGLYDGKEWGPWRFSAESMTLDFESELVEVDRDGDGNPITERRESYYVDLDRALNAQDVLDWLGQINGKGWGPAALGYLVEAFDEVLTFQGRLAHDAPYRSREELFGELRDRIGMKEDEK